MKFLADLGVLAVTTALLLVAFGAVLKLYWLLFMLGWSAL